MAKEAQELSPKHLNRTLSFWSKSYLTLLNVLGVRRRAGFALGTSDWFERGATAYKKRQYIIALKAWKQAATGGDAEAHYRIAQLYDRGEGVVRCIPDAVNWYERAAEAGHTERNFNLAIFTELA